MPLCIICESRFSPATFGLPAEGCECSMEFTREDARMRPETHAALRRWWTDSQGKDINTALANWRAEY